MFELDTDNDTLLNVSFDGKERLECIESKGKLKLGQIYTVIKYIGSDMVVLEEIVGSWYIRRFKKV